MDCGNFIKETIESIEKTLNGEGVKYRLHNKIIHFKKTTSEECVEFDVEVKDTERNNGVNKVKENAAWWYLRLAVVIFGIFVWLKGSVTDDFLKLSIPFLWCVGWTALGIFCGLYNDRNEQGGNSKKPWHYVAYFGFVLVVGGLLSFSSLKECTPQTYAYSAFVGLVVGFLGDSLAGLMKKFTGLLR